jgi:hypothetical protein
METGGAACAEEPGEVREHLGAIRATAEKTVNEVRDLALLLRPSMLDDSGLVPALKWQARETAKQTGLPVAVQATTPLTACPTTTRPASTAWCRKLSTIRRAMPARAMLNRESRGKASASTSRCATMAPASIRAWCAGWGCSAWKNAFAGWEGRCGSILSPAAEPW